MIKRLFKRWKNRIEARRSSSMATYARSQAILEPDQKRAARLHCIADEYEKKAIDLAR